MQASLDESSGKLKEAQQALQSMQSSSTMQQVQLTQQLTSQSERLAEAQQVGIPPQKPMSNPVAKPAHHQNPISKPVANLHTSRICVKVNGLCQQICLPQR